MSNQPRYWKCIESFVDDSQEIWIEGDICGNEYFDFSNEQQRNFAELNSIDPDWPEIND